MVVGCSSKNSCCSFYFDKWLLWSSLACWSLQSCKFSLFRVNLFPSAYFIYFLISFFIIIRVTRPFYQLILIQWEYNKKLPVISSFCDILSLSPCLMRFRFSYHIYIWKKRKEKGLINIKPPVINIWFRVWLLLSFCTCIRHYWDC